MKKEESNAKKKSKTNGRTVPAAFVMIKRITKTLWE
jgi:hypothetical protein